MLKRFLSRYLSEKSHFASINVCVKCDKQLKGANLYNSNGTCPFCGNIDNSTITDYKKVKVKVTEYYWCGFCYEEKCERI